MTARQVYEGTATEVNKVQSMTLLLEDFNYFFNKAIYQYINKRYNIYDINQQTTDDIRVLKATIALPVTLETQKVLIHYMVRRMKWNYLVITYIYLIVYVILN